MPLKTNKIIRTVLTVFLVATVCGIFVSMSDFFRLEPNKNTEVNVCEHNFVEVEGQAATCTEDGWEAYQICTECNYSTQTIISAYGHHITSSCLNDSSIVEYECDECAIKFAPAKNTVLNGSNLNFIEGIDGNNTNFMTSNAGTNEPLITDGVYSYVKKTITDDFKQAQCWIPSSNSVVVGCSSECNSVGVLSMDIKVSLTRYFELLFVEGEEGERWSDEWCISSPVIRIQTVNFTDDHAEYLLLGYNGVVLDQLTSVDDDTWTDFVNIVLALEFDSSNDTVVFHYYINGAYKTSVVAPLTTANNSLNCLYMSGKTANHGGGFMFDNVYYGFTDYGKWDFN